MYYFDVYLFLIKFMHERARAFDANEMAPKVHWWKQSVFQNSKRHILAYFIWRVKRIIDIYSSDSVVLCEV